MLSSFFVYLVGWNAFHTLPRATGLRVRLIIDFSLNGGELSHAFNLLSGLRPSLYQAQAPRSVPLCLRMLHQPQELVYRLLPQRVQTVVAQRLPMASVLRKRLMAMAVM